VTAGDFNNDNKLDLTVPDYRGNSLSVLLGNGNGTFQQEKTHASGSSPKSVTVGDFNNDTKLDLVVANSGETSDDTELALAGANLGPGCVSILLNSCP
jgi:hypothetical protein